MKHFVESTKFKLYLSYSFCNEKDKSLEHVGLTWIFSSNLLASQINPSVPNSRGRGNSYLLNLNVFCSSCLHFFTLHLLSHIMSFSFEIQFYLDMCQKSHAFLIFMTQHGHHSDIIHT